MAILLLLLVANFMNSTAYALPPAGDIAIIEFKMTGSESVVIENISASAVNLQNYLLEYFNKSSGINFNLPTDSQQLPSFILEPQQSFLLSGDTMATCGAVGEANLGMSLSDTNGYFEVVKVAQASGTITYTSHDHVSWTSSAAPVSPLPSDGIDLHSTTTTLAGITSTNAVWYRKLSDGSWIRYGIDTTPCNLFVTVSTSSDTTYVQWANGEQAPSTVVVADGQSGALIPSSDIGLAAPQITEVLPNPASPQTDADDEFIELYNSNNTAFDLTGFTLQVGLTTKHNYTFPPGTNLPARGYTAYLSTDTNLSSSNSRGRL